MSDEMYIVSLRRDAEKELARLPLQLARRIVKKLKQLAKNPRPRGCRKLKLGRGWRVRVSNYRVLYEIDDEEHEVMIYAILHRREAYR